jgi:N6-adenosine-specific RNA methylase IME4
MVSTEPRAEERGTGPGFDSPLLHKEEEVQMNNLLQTVGEQRFGTILADPPWRFMNGGKVSPEYERLFRYDTMSLEQISSLPVGEIAADASHCYLWTPNALLAYGMHVLEAWGFDYKTMIVWHKVRKDGGSDGRGMGYYFRNVTEPVLFGVRGHLRTLAPGRRQVNLLATRKREHSRKPDELYPIIEGCSPGPRIELFARHPREGWSAWGDESSPATTPRGKLYPGYGLIKEGAA